MRPLIWILLALFLGTFASAAEPVGTRKEKLAFRQVLITQAEQAVKDKKIDRRSLLLIRAATLNPRILAKVQDAVVEKAMEVKQLPPNANVAAIDWEKLAAFIKEIMPVVLELIKALLAIFAQVPVPDTIQAPDATYLAMWGGGCAGGQCPTPAAENHRVTVRERVGDRVERSVLIQKTIAVQPIRRVLRAPVVLFQRTWQARPGVLFRSTEEASSVRCGVGRNACTVAA